MLTLKFSAVANEARYQLASVGKGYSGDLEFDDATKLMDVGDSAVNVTMHLPSPAVTHGYSQVVVPGAISHTAFYKVETTDGSPTKERLRGMGIRTFVTSSGSVFVKRTDANDTLLLLTAGEFKVTCVIFVGAVFIQNWAWEEKHRGRLPRDVVLDVSEKEDARKVYDILLVGFK